MTAPTGLCNYCPILEPFGDFLQFAFRRMCHTESWSRDWAELRRLKGGRHSGAPHSDSVQRPYALHVNCRKSADSSLTKQRSPGMACQAVRGCCPGVFCLRPGQLSGRAGPSMLRQAQQPQVRGLPPTSPLSTVARPRAGRR